MEKNKAIKKQLYKEMSKCYNENIASNGLK